MTGFDWGKRWGKRRIRGVDYDLGHLDPYVFEVVPGDPKAPPIKVAASFHLHTFTRDRDPADTPDLHMGNAFDPRSFSFERYECSKHIRAVIQKASQGTVYRSHHDNLLAIDTLDGLDGEYAVPFQVGATPSLAIPVRMWVLSAHERTNPLSHREGISFYTLVRKIAAGEPLPWQK